MGVSVKGSGGGGLTSEDVTASTYEVLSGYTALTTDSNDEAGAGSILTYSWDITTEPVVKLVEGGTATGVRLYTYKTSEESTLKTELLALGYYEEDLTNAVYVNIKGRTTGTVILDLTNCGTAGDVITLVHKKNDNTWETLYIGAIPDTYQVTVTLTEFSPVTKAAYVYRGLCFTAGKANSTVAMTAEGASKNFSYSTDSYTWNTFTAGTTTITLANVGDKVYFKGNNSGGINSSTSNCAKFVLTGSIAASGNIMSLIDNGACTCKTIPNAFCFYSMFSGCASLTTSPELPATTLTARCYGYMFSSCTSMSTPPALPATTLQTYCYQAMFLNSGVTTAPELPATTLVNSCYTNMFNGCTSLTTAPQLVATTLDNCCYDGMFNGCSKLYVSDTYETTSTKKWTIPASGTATGNYTMSNMFTDCLGTRSTNSPNFNGTLITYYTLNTPVPKILNALCFTALTGGSTISTLRSGTLTLGQNILYSTDLETWNTCTIEAYSGTTIRLANIGDKVWFKGNNPNGLSESWSAYFRFFMQNGSLKVSGDVMSLIDDGACDATTIPSNYCFGHLFDSSSKLTSADELQLSASVLTSNCYSGMFYKCTSLTSTPKLPITTLSDYCYSLMFSYCSSLTTAPTLPATTLTSDCYYSMFMNCTSLTTPPALPATTMLNNCYGLMFSGCTSLTTAPELPATTLAYSCYGYMFQGCTSLTTPPELPATTVISSCYSLMFSGCTSLTTAPALPAATLAYNCYSYMFENCSSLTTPPALPIVTTYQDSLSRMFKGCTSLIVSDQPGEGYDKEWRIPTEGVFKTSGYCSYYYVFQNCATGSGRADDNMTAPYNNSYTHYTQNTPVS